MRCFAVWHVLCFIHLTLSSTVPFVHVSPLPCAFGLGTRTIILLVIKFLTPVGEEGGVGGGRGKYGLS